MIVTAAQRLAEWLHPLSPAGLKSRYEEAYWRWIRLREGEMTNFHFEEFFTTRFGMTRDDYEGAAVLDVGCGPRGSLEWAVGASERVGVDPLAERYARWGAGRHAMTYVAAAAEHMPFGDARFDVVSSFNSLDHVDDVDAALSEIARVTKPGGSFLLITDVGHRPTLTEPQRLDWDLLQHAALARSFERVDAARYERCEKGIFESVRRAVPFDESTKKRRYGVLKAHFRRLPGERAHL